jgi:hypothetical protein
MLADISVLHLSFLSLVGHKRHLALHFKNNERKSKKFHLENKKIPIIATQNPTKPRKKT